MNTQNSEIQYGESNIWWIKTWKLLNWNENEYPDVSEIFDYESTLKIQKLKIVDVIWRTKIT